MDMPQERNFEELLIEELQAPAVEFDGSFRRLQTPAVSPRACTQRPQYCISPTVLFCRSEQAFSFLSKR